MPDKAEGDKTKEPETSRREAFKNDGLEDLDMPPCDAIHIVGYLFETGPTVAAGMGESVLSHSEIRAWQSNTGVNLQAWEARYMRKLSAEYLCESHAAKKRDCPAPWLDAPYLKPAKNIVACRMQQALIALAAM